MLREKMCGFGGGKGGGGWHRLRGGRPAAGGDGFNKRSWLPKGHKEKVARFC